MNNDPFVHGSQPFQEPVNQTALDAARTYLDMGYIDKSIRTLIERVEQLEEMCAELNNRIEIRD